MEFFGLTGNEFTWQLKIKVKLFLAVLYNFNISGFKHYQCHLQCTSVIKVKEQCPLELGN